MGNGRSSKSRPQVVSRPAYAAYANVRDLLGSYGTEAPWAVIARLASELDDGGRITMADFVAALGDVAKEVRRGK